MSAEALATASAGGLGILDTFSSVADFALPAALSLGLIYAAVAFPPVSAALGALPGLDYAADTGLSFGFNA